MRNILTSYIMNNLRILKAKNLGDNYYEEYLKHLTREGDKFYDQYHFAIERVLSRMPKKILEVGVRTGLSICNMLSAYLEHSVLETVVLIDLWNDNFASENVVRMNLQALNIPLDKIRFIKGNSRKELPRLLNERFDYILVDGDHSKEGARKDLEDCVELCEKKGVIVFDDISPYGCDLKDVWMRFKADHINQFEFGENYNGKGVGWAEKK